MSTRRDKASGFIPICRSMPIAKPGCLPTGTMSRACRGRLKLTTRARSAFSAPVRISVFTKTSGRARKRFLFPPVFGIRASFVPRCRPLLTPRAADCGRPLSAAQIDHDAQERQHPDQGIFPDASELHAHGANSLRLAAMWMSSRYTANALSLSLLLSRPRETCCYAWHGTRPSH